MLPDTCGNNIHTVHATLLCVVLYNYCCHGNTTVHSLFVADVGVGVNNTIVLHVAVEMQQWVLFALLSSYKIFHIAVNNSEY